MGFYKKQYKEYTIIYSIMHFILGAFSTFIYEIILIYILYEFLQYLLSLRFYFFNCSFKLGHNFKHLCNKFFDFLLGFLFYIFFYIFDFYYCFLLLILFIILLIILLVYFIKLSFCFRNCIL